MTSSKNYIKIIYVELCCLLFITTNTTLLTFIVNILLFWSRKCYKDHPRTIYAGFIIFIPPPLLLTKFQKSVHKGRKKIWLLQFYLKWNWFLVEMIHGIRSSPKSALERKSETSVPFLLIFNWQMICCNFLLIYINFIICLVLKVAGLSSVPQHHCAPYSSSLTSSYLQFCFTLIICILVICLQCLS